MHTNRCIAYAAAAAAVTLALSACSNSGMDMGSMSSTAVAPPSASAGGDTPAQDHNEADVAFARGMVPHHQQAIEMSDMLLAKQGIDPRVVSLANEIKAAQGPEIEQLQGWLADWAASMSPGSGMPNMPRDDMGDMDMGDMDMGDMGGMGMMSEQDMADLQNAQGVAASRLFLTQMTEHHEGAIAMAQTEVDKGRYPPAVELARSITTSQQQEIDTMRQILGSL